MKGFTLIELMIVICIIGILTAIVAGAVTKDREDRENLAEIEITTDPNYGRLQNPDGTFVRPSNDHRTPTVPTGTIDSISEVCHAGIVYVRIIKDGIGTQSAKENRYGDRERC